MSTDAAANVSEDTARAKRIFESQRQYRWGAKQTTTAERRALLERLKVAVSSSLDDVIAALRADLGRPSALSRAEIGAVLHDIDDAVTNLEEWMAR